MNTTRSLVKASIILLVGINLYNLTNLIYQLITSRMLSINEYRELGILINLIYLFAIATESIQLILAKYTASQTTPGQIKNIIKKSIPLALGIGGILLGIYALSAVYLAHFLTIDYSLLIFNGALIIGLWVIPIARGVLQGAKRFTKLGGSLVSEGVIKIVMVSLSLAWGWGVYGAIGAVMVGVICSVALSFYFLKDILSAQEEKAKVTNIKSYARPVFLINAIILCFMASDILLVNVFFGVEEAAEYTFASVLGKIVYLATNPIGKALFPLTAENEERKIPSLKLYLFALALTLSLVICAILGFSLFGETIIALYTDNKVLPLTEALLLPVTLCYGLLAIVNVTLLYRLSLANNLQYKKFVIACIFLFCLWMGLLQTAHRGEYLSFAYFLIIFSLTMLGTVVSAWFLLAKEREGAHER